jgi:membrane-bound ClpP family serine protease
MKKQERRKLIEEFNLIIGSIGVFLLLLGGFRLLGLDTNYLILSLIAIGVILFVWKLILENKK